MYASKFTDLITTPTVMDGVVISPLDKVYEKPAEGEEKIEEDEDNDEDEGDASMDPEN